MLQAPAGRAQRPGGSLRDELLNEAASIAVIVVGILLTLALASERSGANLVGRFGSALADGLTFVVGGYVAYLIPVLVLTAGVAIWRGKKVPRTSLRILGLFSATICTCALFAIPHSQTNFDKQEGFYAGGALGNFLMHQECLHLTGYLGRAGAYLLFAAAWILSVSVMTDVRIRKSAAIVTNWVRGIDLSSWRGKLSAFLDQLRVSLESPAAEETADTEASNASTSIAALRSRRMTGTAPAPATLPASPAPAQVKLNNIVNVLPAAPAPVQEQPAAAAVVDVSPPMLKPKARIPEPEADDLITLAEAEVVQEELALLQPYATPGLDILNAPPKIEHRMSESEMLATSEALEKTLSEFGISATVVQVTQGPTVTRFEVQPAPGVKVARIASLENDIAMCMKAESVRIIAPVPGRGTVGLEVPNKKATPVYLAELLATEAFRNHQSPLAFALGKTISGEPYICDLAAMPHLLIAGTTGSGKSVCLNSIICSILFRMEPDKVKMVMVDPKRVELNVYQAIPHLLAPVVCEPRKAAAALTWAIEEMEERYKKLAALGVRNIDGYNAIVRSKEPHPKAIGRQLEYMPHIVIVIDELADLMIIAKNEVEDSIIRLAQMSRAVGMHLILATQRPSVNVITGIIKANFPSRVAFQVSSKVDSRTILDTNGAESLLGRGDMLFSPGGSPKPIRLQGCFLTDQEVERTADWVRAQAKANYVKTDFLTKQEIEEQRMRAGQEMGRGGKSAPPPADDELRMNGVDADEYSVAADDGDPDDYDYSYQQQRRDGRDLKEVLGVSAGGTGGGAARAASSDDSDAIDEELFRQAAKLILVHRKASVSLLQRKLKIGFARAGRVMDMLDEEGIVGPNVGSKVREILVDPDEYLESLEAEEEAKF